MRPRAMMSAAIHVLGLSVAAIPALAETTDCSKISTVPTIINKPGVYCLTKSLSTGITLGSAIDIQTDDVVLDLNGWSLTATHADNQARGIGSSGYEKLTIRNGTIRGFGVGIHLEDTRESVVEHMRVNDSIYEGIFFWGTGGIVRDNQVSGTGGPTFNASGLATGIRGVGLGVRVVNNDVTETLPPKVGPLTGTAVARGIVCAGGPGTIENNRVFNSTVPNTKEVTTRGISVAGAYGLVVNNRVASMSTCIDGGPGGVPLALARDNIVVSCVVGFQNVNDLGNNQTVP